MDYSTITNLLKQISLPAMGCTEPAALAYAVATARSLLSSEAKSIKVVVDKKFHKNCRKVMIAKTALKGLDYAIAFGYLAGKPEYELEIFRDLQDENIKTAEELVARGLIKVEVSNAAELHIDVTVVTETEKARCLIEKSHSNVTVLELNNQPISGLRKNETAEYSSNGAFKMLSLSLIIDYINNVGIDQLEHLEAGCKMNFDAASAGLEQPDCDYFSLAMSRQHRVEASELSDSDLVNYAKLLTTAACDVRLSGKPCSIMSLVGSGNLGITSMVPILAAGKMLQTERELILRAIALSQLVTYYIKQKIGVLSSVCGCAVAGGVGAAAGLVYLRGGNEAMIYEAINNMLGIVAGMICDGAKKSCAMKVSIATSAAFESAILALKGISIDPGDGFIEADIEQTLENFKVLSVEGMKEIEDILLNIFRR